MSRTRPNSRLDRIAYGTIAVLVFTIGWNGIRLAGGSFANAFFVLAALIVLTCVVVERRAIAIPPWLLATAGGLVVSALAVAIFPPSASIDNTTLLSFNQQFLSTGQPVPALLQGRSNVSVLLKFEIALLLLPVLIAIVATTPDRINRLLDLWTISAVINAAVGVLDYGGFHALATVPFVGNRSGGLTIHANYLALTCDLAIPTALRWIGRPDRFGRTDRWTIAGLVATAILLAGEYTTGSRDGNVAAIIGLVLTIAFVPRLRVGLRYVLPAVGMFAVAVLMFTHAGRSILNQVRLNGSNASGSNYERAILRGVADRQISARPVTGVGLSVINDAQNIYLQILAAGGALLMSFFLIFLGGLANSVRASLHGPLRDEGIVVGVCVLVWWINGYYDSQLADKYLYVLPGLLIACAYVTSAQREVAPAAPVAAGATPRRPRYAAVGVGVEP